MRIKLAIAIATVFAIPGCGNSEESGAVKKKQSQSSGKKFEESSSRGLEGGGSVGGQGNTEGQGGGGQVNNEGRGGGDPARASTRDQVGTVGQKASRDQGVTLHQDDGGSGAHFVAQDSNGGQIAGGLGSTGGQVSGGQRVHGLTGQNDGGLGSAGGQVSGRQRVHGLAGQVGGANVGGGRTGGPSGQDDTRSSVGGEIRSSGGLVDRGPKPRQLGLGNFDSKDFSQIVVIPDVHGDADHFIHSLWIAFNKIEPVSIAKPQFEKQLTEVANGVVFPSGQSRVVPAQPLSRLGKRVAIVQLGDIMDRGPRSLFSYKILASIETAIGWKLIQLFGNHELMIYNPGVYGGFYLRYNKEPTDIPNEEAKKLFAPGGALRDYTLKKNLIVARIGAPPNASVEYRPNPATPDTLFVHANVDLIWADYFLSSIGKKRSQKGGDWLEFVELLNTRKREEFTQTPQSTADLANDGDGPLFTRAIPEPPPGETRDRQCALLHDFMARIHVSRVIVGHTPDSDNHTTRVFCDNTFIIADVAMSRSMSRRGDGQPYALIMNLSNGGTSVSSITAHYDHYMYQDSAHKRDQDLSASR